ncbi:MAG: TIGR03564 family F420-dependent LLM class oxidoreductase [Gammaproteobacteria bacterium]|nr:TIGR03564 family F420-dependent LLM class oxidoreductase [Gammaproteobacteria bacterium]
MKIGILGKNLRQGASLASLVDEVVGYEEQGFASYWMQQASTFHALTMMGLIGHNTTRIELGLATIPTYPRHPGAMLHQASTVNVLAGGRLVLGIGPTAEPEYETLGLSYGESVRHIRDYLSVTEESGEPDKAELGADEASAEVESDFPEPEPYKVVVSALTPEMRRAAGRVADGAVTWMVSQKTIRDHTVPEIKKAAEAADRDAPRVAVGLPVCVHDDEEQAVARANEVYSIYGELPTYRRQLDAQGVENPGDIAVVGNESEVEAQLKTYFDAGATEIVASIYPAGDDRRGSVVRSTECLRGLL